MASPNIGPPARNIQKQALARAVESVFYCYPAMVRDPWLDSLRGQAEFERILDSARALHEEARTAFQAEGGESLLGMVG